MLLISIINKLQPPQLSFVTLVIPVYLNSFVKEEKCHIYHCNHPKYEFSEILAILECLNPLDKKVDETFMATIINELYLLNY